MKIQRVIYILLIINFFPLVLQAQQTMFSEQLLNAPSENSTALEDMFTILEVPEFVINRSENIVFLENGYAQYPIKNPEEWATIMDTRQATEIFLVYTKYPPAKEDWIMNYHTLLADRLKELFSIDPTLNDKRIKWKIYLQTDCPTKEKAYSMFHGIVIKHKPAEEQEVTQNDEQETTEQETTTNEQTPPVPAVSTTEINRVRQFIEDEGGTRDSTVYNVFRRHPEWQNSLVVMDWTGSMYVHGALAVLWHSLHFQESGIKHFAFFNDGDDKRSHEKTVGLTGGIYYNDASSISELLDLFGEVKSKGDGGEPEENDIEALYESIKKFPDADEVILIADNTSCVRDMRILSKIRVPVHVILCGYNESIGVNPQYIELAYTTKGSLHTAEHDVERMEQRFDNLFRVTPPDNNRQLLRVRNHICGETGTVNRELEKLRVAEDRRELQRLDKLRKMSEFFSYEDLMRSTIYPSLDDGLKRASKVYILRMSDRRLTEVNPLIKNLENLQALFLQKNKLTTLPAEMAELKYLQYINLSENRFEELPLPLTELKHLQIIDLSNNQLTTLPENISDIRKLEILYLQNNPIPDTEKARIKQLLPNVAIFYE